MFSSPSRPSFASSSSSASFRGGPAASSSSSFSFSSSSPRNKHSLSSRPKPRSSSSKNWLSRAFSSTLGAATRSASGGSNVDDDSDNMEEETGPEQILDLDLTLGTMGAKTRMVFTESGWQVDGAVVREYEQKIQELTDQLCEVNYKARESETACRRANEGNAHTGEELSTLKFKNQLLIEMLAIAQLDESHARQSYQREKVKAEEYRRELERCYVRMLKAGVDPQR